MAAARQPSKLVVFFMENHTADNLCSDVAGFDGDTSLAQAADAHPDQPHDRTTWLNRANLAVRERFQPASFLLCAAMCVQQFAVSDIGRLGVEQVGSRHVRQRLRGAHVARVKLPGGVAV